MHIYFNKKLSCFRIRSSEPFEDYPGYDLAENFKTLKDASLRLCDLKDSNYYKLLQEYRELKRMHDGALKLIQDNNYIKKD